MELEGFKDQGVLGSFNPADHVGDLLVIEVEKSHEEISTAFGIKPAVDCNIFIAQGNQAGTTINDVRLFGSVIVLQLAPYAGRRVVGRLGSFKSSYGNVGFKLLDAEGTDIAVARKALGGSGSTPVSVPTIAEVAGDDAPPGF